MSAIETVCPKCGGHYFVGMVGTWIWPPHECPKPPRDLGPFGGSTGKPGSGSVPKAPPFNPHQHICDQRGGWSCDACAWQEGYGERPKWLVAQIEDAERALGQRRYGTARAILRRALELAE